MILCVDGCAELLSGIYECELVTLLREWSVNGCTERELVDRYGLGLKGDDVE